MRKTGFGPSYKCAFGHRKEKGQYSQQNCTFKCPSRFENSFSPQDIPENLTILEGHAARGREPSKLLGHTCESFFLRNRTELIKKLIKASFLGVKCKRCNNLKT